jgi:2-polyprenyl-3-methyl-5-hydroxy-6-metoxy-1,4-benzoquinol methylase
MTEQKAPLNQVYQMKKTFEDYPEIKATFDEITGFSQKHNFVRDDGWVRGRRYDDAVLFHSGVDFEGKLVCDLGARDGIFGPWLTQFVNKIHVSDYFEQWEGLGDLAQWTNIWNTCAPRPDRMVCEHQDMTALTYPDNYFDIVISTSVIEHLYNQRENNGDTIAMKEMVRVCKPGGIILLSTDMAPTSRWVSGTYYYSYEDLFKRLIVPSGCTLRGDHAFDLNDPHCDAITEHNGFSPVSSVVFSLVKPK